jgi:hypothetical protein
MNPVVMPDAIAMTVDDAHSSIVVKTPSTLALSEHNSTDMRARVESYTKIIGTPLDAGMYIPPRRSLITRGAVMPVM